MQQRKIKRYGKFFFNRYVWLIDTIQRHDYITFSDISDLWQYSSLNDDGTPLPERTFFNHREAFFYIFGIEIRFDKSLSYYLADGIRNWLLTSLSVNNLINESAEMRSRIPFKHIPSGRKYLCTVINAMKESVMLEMIYRKFSDTEARTVEVAPYCLNVYKQRWYMVARPDADDRPSDPAHVLRIIAAQPDGLPRYCRIRHGHIVQHAGGQRQ